LCGITVAPRIPIAMYSLLGSARMEAWGHEAACDRAQVGTRDEDLEQEAAAMVAISATTGPRAAGILVLQKQDRSARRAAVIAMPHARECDKAD